MKHFAVVLSALLIAGAISLNAQNTTKNVVVKASNDAVLQTLEPDSAANVSHNPLFAPEKIQIRGFDKKISDSRESFFITNNTGFRISRIKIRLEYYDIQGHRLHSRTETVECELSDGETKMASVSSFDRNRTYYYYQSRKPKRSAIPFKAAYKILRYDIIAE